ncbi:MAG TPA: ferrous iron transport protein B [Euryarchaeota archaeon]|jgi:ferrous iron transport protein B|nr:ferrous iron transport protein B [Euryarchaeota archaeon]HOB38686.1 ferrous iron transport protein B [Methanomassiliicoccaceae archaeon]HOL07350.1 ferrous iron transport protein B [Methanomassiliicoccaceae archaeon]
MSGTIRIALIGNPNVGKTSIFNSLTGLRQHVGNWPGVTIEKKSGECRHKGWTVKITDLPGTYGLEARSPDERIANEYLVSGEPDVVVQVVDATNLERNLYLTTQLLDMGGKLVLALNMADMADGRGDRLDMSRLIGWLGVPAVRTSAIHGTGLEDLLDAIIDAYQNDGVPRPVVDLGAEIEGKVAELQGCLDDRKHLARWTALRLLGGVLDPSEVTADGSVTAGLLEALNGVDKEEMELDIVDRRYAAISSELKEIYSRGASRRSLSDAIDRVTTHKYLGIPIFLSLMWGMFQLTFVAAAPFATAIDSGFMWLASFAAENIQPEWLASLLGEGVIGGVGAVLVFLPNIMVMFLLIAILEASGYLARAAFIMDRVMSRLGLHGKSFIPMLLGFGCNVPAIMATRTIEDERSRIVTILSAPYISCSARLPVYLLLAGIFFPDNAGTVLFLLYLLGIGVAVLSALLFRRTILKGESSPFIMELPPYRMPRLKDVLLQMWERGSMYLRKAGTIILLGAIMVWALASLPWGVEYGSEASYAGALGHVLEPILAPLGFDWKIAVGLLFGFMAKEIMIAALGVLYGAEEGAGLEEAIAADLSASTAAGLMTFTLLYTPCIAALATIWKETRSVKWTAFSVAYSLAIAYIISFAVTNLGVLL